MTAPVDVLAVLDLSPNVLATLREHSRDTGAFRVTNQGATNLAVACAAALKAAEARAAVAELIELACMVDRSDNAARWGDACRPIVTKARECLARVGGAQ